METIFVKTSEAATNAFLVQEYRAAFLAFVQHPRARAVIRFAPAVAELVERVVAAERVVR